MFGERSRLNGSRNRTVSINPTVPRNTLDVRRQGTAAGSNAHRLDGSPRYALRFAIVASIPADRPTPSPAGPLTPPLAREVTHAERSTAAAIAKMMPEVYEDLRRLAETFLWGERTAHTLQRTALVNEAFLRVIGETNVVWLYSRNFFGIFVRVFLMKVSHLSVFTYCL